MSIKLGRRELCPADFEQEFCKFADALNESGQFCFALLCAEMPNKCGGRATYDNSDGSHWRGISTNFPREQAVEIVSDWLKTLESEEFYKRARSGKELMSEVFGGPKGKQTIN